MTWQVYKDVDDAIHDWLKSLYTTYRDALDDPTVLPLETDIEWDSSWSGVKETSFAVVEDITNHQNLGLGVKTIQFDGFHTVRVTYRYITGTEKPGVIKEMREFITKTLHANSVPLPTALTDEGIRQMLTVSSKIAPVFNTPQGDFWVLEVRVATKVLNDVT